jgi:alpha-1,3-glucan synthase
MVSNQAWKRHGCYVLGSDQYFNMPLGKSLYGCHDDWNALDHFDPTADSRLMFSRFHNLRQVYGALQDGFNLVQRGNWTYFIERPGSNGTATEMGLWSVTRSALTGYQTIGGNFTDLVWLLYTNENATRTYTFKCIDNNWISPPFVSGTRVQNLFFPYETYDLQDSTSSFNDDGKAPWFGCLPSITMDPFGFKALVPVVQWSAPLPVITKFVPGHDARLLAKSSDVNASTVEISFQFNTAMSCDGVTQSISFNMSSSGHGSPPSVTDVQCAAIQPQNVTRLSGAPPSTWSWTATLTNFRDGVLTVTVNNPASTAGIGTGVRFSFVRRFLCMR